MKQEVKTRLKQESRRPPTRLYPDYGVVDEWRQALGEKKVNDQELP